MPNYIFSGREKNISQSDLDNLSKSIGYPLPEEFKSHYLCYNGGSPDLDWVPGLGGWEPTIVHGFYPILYKSSRNDDPQSTLQGHYEWMIQKGVIPKYLLPFAFDPGGNFYCLNLNDFSVCYYTTDSFDSEKSPDENHANAQRLVASSFNEFLEALTDEDTAYGE